MTRSEVRSADRREFLRRLAGLAVTAPIIGHTPLRARPQSPARTGVRGDLAWLTAEVPLLLARLKVPGLAIALVENGAPLWSGGFGVKKAGEPALVTSDTVFEAASLSKPPFAYVVQKLAEEGRIDLDAGIGDFFRMPDFMNDPTVNAITPRIVLAHQTGLPNWRGPQPATFRFKPGSDFSYSGESYVRLQRFVEKTTGMKLDELAAARILRPWQMARTAYLWRAGFDRLAAEGHDAAGRPERTPLWGYGEPGYKGPQRPPGIDIPLFAVPNAAASLYTTVDDYARLLVGLLAPPPADATHLTHKALDAMFTPVSRVNADLSWGLGWGLSRLGTDETFWHWGNNGVYQGFVVGVRARRWGAVVLTNSANGLKACREIVTRLLGAEHPAFRWSLVLPPGG